MEHKDIKEPRHYKLQKTRISIKNFFFQVQDRGDPIRSDSMVCSINIKDKNDQRPIFTFPPTLEHPVVVDQVESRVSRLILMPMECSLKNKTDLRC